MDQYVKLCDGEGYLIVDKVFNVAYGCRLGKHFYFINDIHGTPQGYYPTFCTINPLYPSNILQEKPLTILEAVVTDLLVNN